VDFTREPIIETIITPKEGCKLVVRSSKSAGQEEYFVEALEVVSFGHALFFRSLERPKAFIVPVSDYEVLEVRETRMVLKNAGLDRSIKIGGGREAGNKAVREQEKVEHHPVEEEKEPLEGEESVSTESPTEPRSTEPRLDKKRDRRRNYRKRRGRDDKEEVKEEMITEPSIPALEDDKILITPPVESEEVLANATGANLFSALLQPPPTLISETINRYRENALFKNAFFLSEEEQYKPHQKVQDILSEDDENTPPPHLQTPDFIADQSSENAAMDPVAFENDAQEPSSPLADSLAQEDAEAEAEAIELIETLQENEQELIDESLPLSFNSEKEQEESISFFAEDEMREQGQEEEEEDKAVLPLYAEEELVESNDETDVSISLSNDQKDKDIQSHSSDEEK
jgi:hypothetical protein